MVNAQHEKSDHEEGDELPEELEISDDLRIHLMSIKGANKKLRIRVEEFSANLLITGSMTKTQQQEKKLYGPNLATLLG